MLCISGKVKVNYDNRFDTLYVAFSDGANSYGDDSEVGVIIMRDLNSDSITGFTLFHFMKKFKTDQLPAIFTQLPNSIVREIVTEYVAN